MQTSKLNQLRQKCRYICVSAPRTTWKDGKKQQGIMFDTMPKEKLLTSVEKERIIVLRRERISLKIIAETTGRSVEAVTAFLKASNRRMDQFINKITFKMSLVQEKCLQRHSPQDQNLPRELQNLPRLPALAQSV